MNISNSENSSVVSNETASYQNVSANYTSASENVVSNETAHN